MTQQEIQAKLSGAFRAQPKSKTLQLPAFVMGGAVAVALLAGAAFFFWPSGGALEIHATDRAGVEADLKRMTASVPAADLEAYQSGFLTLILDRYPPAQGLKGFARMALMEPALDAAHDTMDGVTVQDLIAAGRANLDRAAVDAAAKAQADVQKDADKAQADAKKEQVAACLQSRLPIANANVTRGDYGRSLSFTVTNNLPWAISGIYVAYDITSEGRAVPWETDDAAREIVGGMEPGETEDFTYPLTGFPDEAPDALTVTARTIDVADAQQRQLVREVRIIGWSDDLSDQTCE